MNNSLFAVLAYAGACSCVYIVGVDDVTVIGPFPRAGLDDDVLNFAIIKASLRSRETSTQTTYMMIKNNVDVSDKYSALSYPRVLHEAIGLEPITTLFDIEVADIFAAIIIYVVRW